MTSSVHRLLGASVASMLGALLVVGAPAAAMAEPEDTVKIQIHNHPNFPNQETKVVVTGEVKDNPVVVGTCRMTGVGDDGYTSCDYSLRVGGKSVRNPVATPFVDAQVGYFLGWSKGCAHTLGACRVHAKETYTAEFVPAVKLHVANLGLGPVTATPQAITPNPADVRLTELHLPSVTCDDDNQVCDQQYPQGTVVLLDVPTPTFTPAPQGAPVQELHSTYTEWGLGTNARHSNLCTGAHKAVWECAELSAAQQQTALVTANARTDYTFLQDKSTGCGTGQTCRAIPTKLRGKEAAQGTATYTAAGGHCSEVSVTFNFAAFESVSSGWVAKGGSTKVAGLPAPPDSFQGSGHETGVPGDCNHGTLLAWAGTVVIDLKAK